MAIDDKELGHVLDESMRKICEATEANLDLKRLLDNYRSNGTRFRYVMSRGTEDKRGWARSLKKLLSNN